MNPKMMSYDELLRAVNERFKAVENINEDEAIKLLMKEFNLSRSEVSEFLGLTDLRNHSQS